MLFLFLINDLYFLIPSVTTQAFNSTAELALPIGIRTKEVKEAYGTHPTTTKPKMNRCSI